MSKHIFTTNGLKATKWDTEEVKAKFLNDLANFVRSGFKRSKFSKGLYTRLSMTFSHIAHYNIEGFYGEWFTTAHDQLNWLRNALSHPCYGDPEYTYSDAERQFKNWLSSQEGIDIIEGVQAQIKQDEIDAARASKARAEAVLASHGVSA